MNKTSCTQLLVPVYNEGENVSILYDRLLRESVVFDRLTFVYDIDHDSSLPYISQIAENDDRVLSSKNQKGPGILNALTWGFENGEPGPLIVLMGDNSDNLSIINDMCRMWREGATIVSPSRYMRGGRQYGGGLIKAGMSKIAGISLWLLGFPTSDPTNNFKLYDREWISSQTVDSKGGFEIALELSYKAFRERMKIVQLPTEWRDRQAGESKFYLVKWLPHYLRWYCKCLALLFIRYTGIESLKKDFMQRKQDSQDNP
jgi:dolichol-phosphate mannosyltransferase